MSRSQTVGAYILVAAIVLFIMTGPIVSAAIRSTDLAPGSYTAATIEGNLGTFLNVITGMLAFVGLFNVLPGRRAPPKDDAPTMGSED